MQADPPAGRPPRHLYRLSAAGLAALAANGHGRKLDDLARALQSGLPPRVTSRCYLSSPSSCWWRWCPGTSRASQSLSYGATTT